MVRKVIIRMLLAFMLLAFSAVVVVQWLWIKHAFKEQQNRFSSKVYDVLNRVVNRVEELNYMEYMNQMELQFLIGNGVGYNRVMMATVSKQGIGAANREKIEQIMNSIELIGRAVTVRSSYEVIKDKVQELTLRLMQEKDIGNLSVRQRLGGLDLQRLLKLYFRENNITLPFSYEVLTKEEALDKVEKKGIHNFYYTALFPNDYIPKNYYLGVHFASVDSAILGNMGRLLFISGFCVFGLLFVFVLTVVVIMRQQKLSVMKNDFINNMTHEFKTPIATISLATSAMMKDKVLADKEQLLKFNDVIRSENDRMNVYVERILQQAKLDRNELPLNKVEVDMNELVASAAETFLLQVESAGGVLRTELNAPDFVLAVDEVHMVNVICNLLDNAVKYSVDTPVIDVCTRKEGSQFIIGIRDQGIGISREAQKKVFRRFYRVTTGNLHDVKGFGLGLSYAKSIVELHGGKIRIVSKRNKGTLIELVFNG